MKPDCPNCQAGKCDHLRGGELTSEDDGEWWFSLDDDGTLESIGLEGETK